MTELTSGRAEMDISGRHLSARVAISGKISDVAGVQVRVTLYRGKVIHIEGPHLKIDTEGAPATSHTDFLTFGLVSIIGGAVLAGANIFVALGFMQRPTASGPEA